MADDVLRVSVQDLVLTFRQALIGFIPIAERLLMPWRDENQHRDWERVAEAMFDACVRGPIEAEADRSVTEFSMPRYDIDIDSYAEASWICARWTSRGRDMALIRLVTDRDPFDQVHCAIIDPTTLRVVGTTLTPIRDVEFSFTRRVPDAADSKVTEIVAVE